MIILFLGVLFLLKQGVKQKKKASIIKLRSAITTLVHKHLKIMRLDRLKKSGDKKWWSLFKNAIPREKTQTCKREEVQRILTCKM